MLKDVKSRCATRIRSIRLEGRVLTPPATGCPNPQPHVEAVAHSGPRNHVGDVTGLPAVHTFI